MARRVGTMARPVRSSGNLLRVPQPRGPVPWTYEPTVSDGNGVYWVGESREDGFSPIGPHGPWPSDGSTQPVVTRAISLLADPLTAGRFRVRTFATGNAVGELDPDFPRWLTDPQLLRPDARIGPSLVPITGRMARSQFWRTLVALSIGWGVSYLYFIEDAQGSPIAGSLRLINPGLVEVNEDGKWQIDQIVFDDDGRWGQGRLVALRNPHHEEGVFLAHPEAFKIARQIERYTSGTFRSGVPSGYLKVSTPNMSDAQAQALKEKWMGAHSGDSRSVAILSSTVDWTGVALSPVDSALAEVKRLAIADVAFAFNIAPETLGVTLGNSATYSNVSQWFESHRDFSLSPWIAALEGVLSSLMPVGKEVEVNLDAFESPTFADRMDAYEVAIRSGILTVDEARAREGLSPLPPAFPNPPFVFTPESQAQATQNAPEAPVEPQNEQGGTSDAN
jgi:HK97 family phage portal protein